MTTESLHKGYDEIRKSMYGINSILSRSLPHIFMGITGISFVFFPEYWCQE